MARPALWALLIIVPLTLGLRSAQHGERLIDSDRLTAEAASNLAGQRWSVRRREHHLVGSLIEGARGECRILVHFASPEGVTDEKFRRLAQPVGPVTYQYRGRPSLDFPRLLPLLAAHVQRYAWSFGLAVPTAPLVSTARSPSCGGQTPDFTGLRQHLRVAHRAD